MNPAIDQLKKISYAQTYCAMKKTSGIVYVEGIKDVPFWKSIFNKPKNNNYSVYCASKKNGARGKDMLLSFADETHKYLIVAVDSDFDFLCNTECSEKINVNDFVFQTYFHSKESICYQTCFLEKQIDKLSINTSVTFNIKSYLESYSGLIYDLLIAFLYMKENGIPGCNDKKFHSAVKTGSVSLNSNFTLKQNSFDKVRNNTALLLGEVAPFLGSDLVMKEYKKSMKSKGLTRKNSYLYIQGHTFEEGIINPIFNSIKRVAKANEISYMKSELPNDGSRSELIKNRINEIYSYHDSIVLENNVIFDEERMKSRIIKKIINEILQR